MAITYTAASMTNLADYIMAQARNRRKDADTAVRKALRGEYLAQAYGLEQAANIVRNCTISEDAAAELYDVLSELMDLLRREAPGTPLNNHRFDALGLRANNALAKARGKTPALN